MRAIAASMVMCFHLQIFPPGWIGVEVFFVISGFLITRILIDSTRKQPDFAAYLGRFFWRRCLRIFPLYYAVLAIVFFFRFTHGDVLNKADWTLLTYTYNWYRAFHAVSDPTRFTTHFWSLASEEQFYFVWPIVVWIVVRRNRLTQCAIAIIVAGAALRFAARAILPPRDLPWMVYHAGIFQIGSLAVGALIASGPIPAIKRAALWALLLAAAAIAIGAVSGNGSGACFGFAFPMAFHHQFYWGYLAVDAVSAALVIACIQNEPVVRLLEWRPLARLGRVSYGFYVFHPLVIWLVLANMAHSAAVTNAVAFLLTWLLAEFSFTHFESHFLALRNRFWAAPRKAALVAAGTARS